LAGYDPWKFIRFFEHDRATSNEIKTFFIQEMIKRGILISSSLNITYAHKELDRFKLLEAFDEVFFILAKILT
jgi:glutamate-1-semialdehyde aminotransferase